MIHTLPADFVVPDVLVPPYSKGKPNAIETIRQRMAKALEGTPPYFEIGGRLRTRSLFFEVQEISQDLVPYFYPIWTLKNQPRKLNPGHYWRDRYPDGTIPTFRQAYMAIADPTEYQVGEILLGDFSHWQRLIQAKWFQPHLERLRAELRLKLESEAIQAVRATMASMQGNSALQAARWLADRTNPPKRGRPSQAELDKALKEEVQSNLEINEDAERLGL